MHFNLHLILSLVSVACAIPLHAGDHSDNNALEARGGGPGSGKTTLQVTFTGLATPGTETSESWNKLARSWVTLLFEQPAVKIGVPGRYTGLGFKKETRPITADFTNEFPFHTIAMNDVVRFDFSGGPECKKVRSCSGYIGIDHTSESLPFYHGMITLKGHTLIAIRFPIPGAESAQVKSETGELGEAASHKDEAKASEGLSSATKS
ncbi:hypothetical protein BT96DRAFT_981025 [Gymnopus androsaceus JB14]|uniref:Uncharacterized protein n=1 Tax=Gymnopus androsaceus JB14 TaxID=1447944 RepID=A0A6A4GRW6_9AGAR|nr:hypothetical protein BT96DRAFT_981025 [Gymnopus androsaceus JB14]